MTVWYFPIESYTERYTSQLFRWTADAFERNGLEFQAMCPPQPGDRQIRNPGPLDFALRPWFSACQVAMFMDHAHHVKAGDVIYFDDMFTPGFEAIPYYLDRVGLGAKVGIFTRNHAGSCDIHDYIHPSKRWMRHYEKMVSRACHTVFCASPIHKELMSVQGIDNVEVVGLPFDRDEVLSYHPIVPYAERDKRILFASRWDKEKDPGFFIKVAAHAREQGNDYEFAVATGKNELASNDPWLVRLAREAADKGLIRIYEGLSKADYYALVATSEVQFNCAYQDFVSYTMLEASAYGTPTVAPCYRSFPEALFYDEACLYVPLNVGDAWHKIMNITDDYQVDYPSSVHNGTLDRICTAFTNFTISVAASEQ